jgi:CRISPR type I-E-associated protein CasB/Cse2
MTQKPGSLAFNWWRALQPQTDQNGHITSRGNPGALARLRRASSPVEALAEAEAIHLAAKLDITRSQTDRLAYVGALAATLAHVRDNQQGQSMAQMLGPVGKDESGIMSALRFQRLITARGADDLMRQMRNAVKLLKGRANITDLAASIYWWGDKTRINWTYAYWGAAFASPDMTETEATGNSAQETSS